MQASAATRTREFLLVFVLVLSHVGLASTLRVDPDDAAAYARIQDAIDSASTGDEIEVVAGSYSECLTTNGLDLELVGIDGASSTTVSAADCSVLLRVESGETVRMEGFSLWLKLLAKTSPVALRHPLSAVLLHC